MEYSKDLNYIIISNPQEVTHEENINLHLFGCPCFLLCFFRM